MRNRNSEAQWDFMFHEALTCFKFSLWAWPPHTDSKFQRAALKLSTGAEEISHALRFCQKLTFTVDHHPDQARVSWSLWNLSGIRNVIAVERERKRKKRNHFQTWNNINKTNDNPVTGETVTTCSNKAVRRDKTEGETIYHLAKCALSYQSVDVLSCVSL